MFLHAFSPVTGREQPPYEVPFQGLAPPDASLKDMQRLVVTEKQQPTLPKSWNYNKVGCSD